MYNDLHSCFPEFTRDMAKVGQPVEISSHTVDKVTKTKLTLETYYNNLISQHEERESRCVEHFGFMLEL